MFSYPAGMGGKNITLGTDVVDEAITCTFSLHKIFWKLSSGCLEELMLS